jgi:predicted DCC family thiol-disulfide oxidoreductase YuxK
MTSLERPVLLFDGDCAFCTRCAELLERMGPGAEIVAWQLTDLGRLGVSQAQATEAVQLVDPDGTIHSGHEAIASVLTTSGRLWSLVGRTIRLPGISWLAAKSYRLVADNRYRLPGGTPACAVASRGDAP